VEATNSPAIAGASPVRDTLHASRDTRKMLTFGFFSAILSGQRRKARERGLNMLLMSTFTWIIIGVAVVILAVFFGTKIKDKYF